MRQKFLFMAVCLLTFFSAAAKSGYRPAIHINSEVTTHIVMPEMLKLVDISTDLVVGDQCTDNMVRIKPIVSDSIGYAPMQYLGTITLIGERHMVQYDLIYSENPLQASSIHKVNYDQCENYSNPEVVMPEGEMANYAWAISNTKRKYNTVKSSAFGIQASIYNIYTIGDYFFIDLYLKNNTNIAYDIAQMRVTLTDKKETKATNSQTLELTPAYVLNSAKSFKKDYRQVLVLNRLTFPEEKVLNIELSENQISGRVLTIPVEYEDILHADSFDKTKLNAYENVAVENRSLIKEVSRLTKELSCKQGMLDKANKELDSLGKKMKKTKAQYLKMEQKLQAMQELNRRFKKLNEDMASVNAMETIEIEAGEPTPENNVLTLEPFNE